MLHYFRLRVTITIFRADVNKRDLCVVEQVAWQLLYLVSLWVIGKRIKNTGYYRGLSYSAPPLNYAKLDRSSMIISPRI